MKKDRPYFNKIEEFVQNVVQKKEKNQTIVPLSNFGTIKCRYRQRIMEVPFLYPSLVLVILGKKSIYYGDNEVKCSSGDFFAIPAPSRFDVVNIPDETQKTFLALYLPFDISMVERFRRLYRIDLSMTTKNNSIHFKGNEILDSSIWHFLEISNRLELANDLKEHRLMEILLCLVKYCEASHMLLSMSQTWSERLYSLFLANPSRAWLIKDASSFLSVSESTLRRNLRKEDTNFRTVIEDVRMGQALSEIQFTKLPLSIIAENCGYASFSRFIDRFRHRFDITPSQLRRELTESSEILAERSNIY